MRSVLLGLPLLLVPVLPGRPMPACGEAALAAAPDAWDAATALTADFTLDGSPDVVFWKRDDDAVMLYVAACESDRMVRSWRFRIALPADCPPTAAAVEAASLLIDPAVVERLCATGDPSECEHLRRENERRQTTVDAGGRELRITGPGCAAAARLRWSDDLGGFVRVT